MNIGARSAGPPSLVPQERDGQRLRASERDGQRLGRSRPPGCRRAFLSCERACGGTRSLFHPGRARAHRVDRARWAACQPFRPGRAREHCCRSTFGPSERDGKHFASSERNGQRVHRSRPGAHRAGRAMGSAFTVPQLHKVAASVMGSRAHRCRSTFESSERDEKNFVSSERNGQRVHRSRPGAHRVERARWAARSPSRRSIKSQRER